MFNVQGSELIFLLLVALVVLGPEKLPDAVRKFTKAYAEFKKMANGFQGEFRQVLDEPMRELRETANAVRDATKFDFDLDPEPDKKSAAAPTADAAAPAQVDPAAAVSEIKPKTPPAGNRTSTLNFGSANPRRQARIPRDDAVATATPEAPEAPEAPAASPADTPAPAEAPTAEDATE